MPFRTLRAHQWLMSAALLLPAAFCVPTRAYAQQAAVTPHAGLLRYPAISAHKIAFVFANKLWLAPREGGEASPLASPTGRVMFPRFSPDGSTVAFTANYDGNLDIYTLPIDGGIPTRITHHPAAEMLCNWTPDGKLLFSANYDSGIERTDQLYTVSAKGGFPTRIPVPYGHNGAISPDGKTLAYTPDSTDFRTWKRYRGGWAQDVWLFDLQKKSAKRITDWEGTDTLPMWQGKMVYYLSDDGPEHRLNIWKYDTQTSHRSQQTHFADFDLKWPSIGPGANGGGEIIFEHGPDLTVLDLPTGKTHNVEVKIPGDRVGLRPKLVDASRHIMDWAISPNGKRAAVEARGDIWSNPAKNGSPRNLTHSNGSAERSPAWSPDGKWIAYLSDASGEYEIWITQSDGLGQAKQLTHDGKVFRANLAWSPDSRNISFTDKTGATWICSADTGKTTLVDKDPRGGANGVNWSPDSKFITYAKSLETRTFSSTIWIYSLESGKARQVTSGMFVDSAPVFDHKGDYLYFQSNRSFASPEYDDMGSSWVYGGTAVLVAVPLRSDIKSPLLPVSDEETVKTGEKTDVAVTARLAEPIAAAGDEVSGVWKGAAGPVNFTLNLTLGPGNKVTGTADSDQGGGSITGTYDPGSKQLDLTISLAGGDTAILKCRISGNTMTGTATVGATTLDLTAARAPVPTPAPQAGAAKAPQAAEKTTKPVTVKIDYDGFEERAILLPVKSGRFGALAVNDKNQLLFARLPARGATGDQGIKLFDLADENRSEKTVATGATNFDITSDGKKLLVVRGMSAAIQDASAGAAGEPVVTAGMSVMVDPRTEWKQIYNDAWRIERDFFYDPNMHHVDWPAVRDQYARMLNDCATRDDVGYVIGEMISELNVGHTYYGGGDVTPEPSTSVGMIGADFALDNGAYRIKNIVSGAPWDLDARGPLAQPGINVHTGDYLLAVNGAPLDAAQDPWAAFVGKAGEVATLTVSKKPTIDSSAVQVPIKLVADDHPMRYRAWIEHNRAYVEQKTGGRVGYIYVPNTGVDGQNDLVRQFLSQSAKDALIVDERWNGGGQIPDRFIELLNRPVTNYWAVRDGLDWTWPPVSHQGPKCMLINGEAGSGGDAFPWYFREHKLGKLDRHAHLGRAGRHLRRAIADRRRGCHRAIVRVL